MATDNKRVAAYLPPSLYDLLEKFKKETDLSESKAIISILAAHFGVAQEVSQKVAHKFVTVDRFHELQSKVAHLSELLSELKDIQANQGESISEPLSDSPISGQTSIFEAIADEKSSSRNELLNDSLYPMTEIDLVSRFKIDNHKSIGNKRSKCKSCPSDFLEWTKTQDKDGVGWEYHPHEKLYHPVSS